MPKDHPRAISRERGLLPLFQTHPKLQQRCFACGETFQCMEKTATTAGAGVPIGPRWPRTWPHQTRRKTTGFKENYIWTFGDPAWLVRFRPLARLWQGYAAKSFVTAAPTTSFRASSLDAPQRHTGDEHRRSMHGVAVTLATCFYLVE